MTCKDCIHYKVCCQKCLHVVTGMDFVYRYKYNHIERVCKDFKDRSRFVELPCVGDKVYEPCRINQFGDYKIVESEIRGFIVDTNGTAFDYELLGERFFLTLEEAEQALKEREANGQSEN